MKKTTINEKYFESIDSDEKAYFIGLLYADGNLYEKRKRILLNLQERDGYLVEKFRTCIEYSGLLQTLIKPGNRQNQNCVSFYNEKIYSDLEKIGMGPNKSVTCDIPIIPDKYFPGFIRGFFDGDGCIWNNGLKALISITCLQNISEYITEKLKIYDIDTNFKIVTRYNIPFLGLLTIPKKEHMYKLFKMMYHSKDIIYMKRKFEKLFDIFEIRKIQECHQHRYKVIEIDKNNNIVNTYTSPYECLSKGIEGVHYSCLKFNKTGILSKRRFIYEKDYNKLK